MFQNVNGIPRRNDHHRNNQLRLTCQDHNIDIFLCSEVNVNWTKVPFHQRLSERTRGWWESCYTTTAHNLMEHTNDPFQYGGVAIMVRDHCTHRIITSGSDPHKLGRWTWVTLRGQGQMCLRIISAYRPVLNLTGPTSVYAQQQRHFLTLNREGCPRNLFISDLCKEIQQWIEAGNLLILGIDLNEDTHGSIFRREMAKLGLIDLFITRHGHTPSTYQRGSKTIDTIYVSSSLHLAKCGYLPFGQVMPSDHRALWLDLPYDSVFGSNSQPHHFSKLRRLRCHDPRIVESYNYNLWTSLTKADAPARLLRLTSEISYPPLTQHIQEWEQLDAIRVTAMLQADRQCRKLKVGAVPWSPEIQRSIDTITYWTLKIKKLRRGKVSSRLLRRLKNKAQIAEVGTDIPTASQHLRNAAHQYRINKRQAQELRTTWLEDLANARASRLGGTAAQQLAAMARREITRRESRACRKALGKLTRNSLTAVIAPNSEGQWTEWYQREDIETACLQENRRRFQQASNTPFLSQPLRELVDRAASGNYAQAIRAGTAVVPPTVDQYTINLIHALRRPSTLGDFPSDITLEEYQKRWSKAREYTATGFSGLHFGHFMAAARHHELSQFDLGMTRLPFQYGFAPSRWRKGVDVAIPKKPGNFRVDALRTILLLEPDFNFLNKIIGSRMMWHAEHNHLLAPEQYGSRRHKSAADHVVNKRLTFDLSRQHRHPLGLCSNDAQGCYDRIVWPVASLSMQRVGAPIAPIEMMINTLSQMQHHVSSSFGVSQASYQCDETPLFHGIGQGNGAAPAVWAVISTPMLNLQRHHGFGAKFENPLTHQSLHIAGYAFVDDTDICQTGNPYDHPTSILTKLQQSLNLWTGSLTATGGALTPHKSFWVLCSYSWHDGKWKYQDSDLPSEVLRMSDSSGTSQVVERISPSEGRRTLGVRLAADGSNEAERTYLRQQSQLWADYIRAGHLPRHLAWRALRTMLWPKLIYPLPATTFSHQDCRYIMAPALTAGLAASGIVGTFPRALTHSSYSALGLAIWDLYDAQGWAHINVAIRHGPDLESITGKLLRCSLAALQIELGLPGSPLSQDFDIVGPIVTESWVKTLWRYLWDNDLQILDDTPQLPLQRENDFHLMSAFIQLGHRKGELAALNRCRLYLQVTTVAEITTGCGHYITDRAWKGQHEPETPRLLGWPTQIRPNSSDWGQWRKALTLLTQSSPRHQLPTPLGRWLTAATPLTWHYSPGQDRLYRQLSDGKWVFHTSQTSRSGRSRSRRFRLQAQFCRATPQSEDFQRAIASIDKNHIIMSGCAPTIPPPILTPPSFSRYLRDTPSHSSWLYEGANLAPINELLGQAISHDQCRACCDGSYRVGIGAASWVITDHHHHQLIGSAFHIPGHPDQHSPLRGELAGIYAVTLTIFHACQYFAITKGKVELGSDAKTALSLSDLNTGPDPSIPNYDLVSAIRWLKSNMPITWQYRHIPAHQENIDPTDWWTTSHSQMDAAAKAKAADPPGEPVLQVLGLPWLLLANQYQFSFLDKQAFFRYITEPRGYAYWLKRQRLSQQAIPYIDTTAIHSALATSSLAHRTWVVKQASGFSGVGTQMMRYKKWDNNRCPRCGLPEDAPHVLRCVVLRDSGRWSQALDSLAAWMDSHNTNPELRDIFIFQLRQWNSEPSVAPHPSNSSILARAVVQQALIGWGETFNGFLSRAWAQAQQEFASPSQQGQSQRWITQLIKKLWATAWDFWAHRNGYLYLPEAQDQSLNAQIQAVYAQDRSSFHPSVHRWLDTSLATLLTRPRRVRHAWLRHVRLLISTTQTREANELRRSRQLLRRWLQGSH